MTETKKDLQMEVYNYARACGLSDFHSKIIVSQATFESGNFTNRAFKIANNYFGMKMPSRRPKTYIDGASSIVMQSEGSTPYANYNSRLRSVQDLIQGWHAYNKTDWNKITSPEVYASYLKKKGYYGGQENIYRSSLASITSGLNWIKEQAIKNPGLPIALIIFAGFFFFITKKK
jgi:uncharacterized FlgJ-related protein